MAASARKASAPWKTNAKAGSGRRTKDAVGPGVDAAKRNQSPVSLCTYS